MNYLRLGDTGPEILTLKKNLNLIGAHLDDTDVFDDNTLHAVYNVQRAYKLLQDGVVGPLTSNAISDALAKNNHPTNPGIPTSGTKTHGIDIYRLDVVNSFSAVKNAGFEFVIHKASQGTSSVDTKIAARAPQIRNAGLIFGAYLFYNPGQDPQSQADTFLRVYSPLQKDGDLPPSLDFGENDIPHSQALNDAGLFIMEKMEKATGMRPMCYGAVGLLGQYGLSADYAKYPAWLADPSHTPPRLPKPWTNFALHQYLLDNGTVPGIRNGCDCDYYPGTLDELKAFIKNSKV